MREKQNFWVRWCEGGSGCIERTEGDGAGQDGWRGWAIGRDWDERTKE